MHFFLQIWFKINRVPSFYHLNLCARFENFTLKCFQNISKIVLNTKYLTNTFDDYYIFRNGMEYEVTEIP